MKRGIEDNHGAKHVDSMVDSIKRLGRLDEATMTFQTLGFIRSLGMIPFGLKMQMHGKMPHPHLFSNIEGMDEVRKIYKVHKQERKKEKQKLKKGVSNGTRFRILSGLRLKRDYQGGRQIDKECRAARVRH